MTELPPKHRQYSVSVAMPAYNEWPGLHAVISAWASTMAAESRVTEWEIVVCDDGSEDCTVEGLSSLDFTDGTLRVVRLPRNYGPAVAVATAIQQTTLPWVLVTDSDGQFPACNLTTMLDALDNGAVAVSGARASKKDLPTHRAGASMTTWVTNALIKAQYEDVSSIFKLVDGTLLRSLQLESSGLNVSIELTARIHERGVRWVEVSIEHAQRVSGQRAWALLPAARDRAAYVAYLGVRRFLITSKVLHPPVAIETETTQRVGDHL